jgi:hypothetical protein
MHSSRLRKVVLRGKDVVLNNVGVAGYDDFDSSFTAAELERQTYSCLGPCSSTENPSSLLRATDMCKSYGIPFKNALQKNRKRRLKWQMTQF